MSVFSFATPLSSSFNPPLVSRSRKKSIFFGGLEMDIFGWKRWKRGEEGSIWIFNWRVWDDFRSQEIGGRGRFDCSFFFFSFYAYKISNTNTKFSNKLIIQVQQIIQVTNSEFFFFFFFGFDFESIWWLFDCGDSKGVKLSVNVIYFIQWNTKVSSLSSLYVWSRN